MKLVSGKYQAEIQSFRNNFAQFQNKRIVLYGIGRLTAVVLNACPEFQFVGLMDKDSNNIGKKMFGLPVLSMQETEKMADIVIINTQETYWKVIFERIELMKIPIYYRNGIRAEKSKVINYNNPYRDLNFHELYRMFNSVQTISFDFFDTLFIRTVCNPRDVFEILEIEIARDWKLDKAFCEIRSEAISELGDNYTHEELYKKIEQISQLRSGIIQDIRQKEIYLEKKLLSPRKDMLHLLASLLKGTFGKKDIYIISDMYFPKEFYIEVLKEHDILLDENRILISNELKLSKADGNLWKYYREYILGEKEALHVGDNIDADIINPTKYSIQTYLTPSPYSLLEISSLKKMASHICTAYASASMGCILRRLFENPYILANKNGVLSIESNRDMGYLVLGPVILTFLLWLNEQKRKDAIQMLVFLSRDGYFLKEDYEYLCNLLDIKSSCCYLGISRQLAMSASIENEEDLREYVEMPYSGTIQEMFEDRFGITNIDVINNGTVEQYVNQYHEEIWNNISNIRNNYLKYLENFQFGENSAIVDVGFYGNNQRYLIKLLHLNLIGYYFGANISNENENVKYQKMITCFQGEEDLSGEHCRVIQNAVFIESVFTAPYGMVREIDDKGEFVCAPCGMNQRYFQCKEEINQGIKDYIHDYIQNFGRELPLDIEFIDWYFGYCMDGAFVFSDSIKKSFFNDNAMMNRIESTLFY